MRRDGERAAAYHQVAARRQADLARGIHVWSTTLAAQPQVTHTSMGGLGGVRPVSTCEGEQDISSVHLSDGIFFVFLGSTYLKMPDPSRQNSFVKETWTAIKSTFDVMWTEISLANKPIRVCAVIVLAVLISVASSGVTTLHSLQWIGIIVAAVVGFQAVDAYARAKTSGTSVKRVEVSV